MMPKNASAKITSIKVAVCQTAPRVGAIKENFAEIAKLYKDYNDNSSADIVVFPELATSGYLAQDLLHKTAFIQKIADNISELVKHTGATTLLLPTPYLHDGKLYNAVLAIQNGEIIGRTFKKELPNFGIFDEQRYFTSGNPALIEIDGLKIGVPICEDIWHPDTCKQLADKGAELFIVPNGSPYDRNKHQRRLEVIKERFIDTKVPFIYCNQSLGQDGIVFDGKSFCYDGHLSQFGPSCQTSSTVIEFKENKFIVQNWHKSTSTINDIYNAMKLGLKDYVQQNGFKKVLLGISGGIDSAIVACICVDSLGAENVSGYMLPSKFSSQESKEDATTLANNLGINIEEIDISSTVEQSIKAIDNEQNGGEFNWKNADLVTQNLQSRIRGLMLMAISNRDNALLITTGNKSEYATGYATIYGDMNGAFNPIKDIYKSEIYDLAAYRNSLSPVIPNNIITKAPSAELAPNQKDADNLPDYELLDKILFAYIEEDLSTDELKNRFPAEIVDKTVKLVNISEYKRQQSAPGVKISTRDFGRDRRYPITNDYDII